MGLGLSITTVELEWPTQEVLSRCPQCGSTLSLTRYMRFMGVELPPALAAEESEQLCGVCGAPGCEEPQKQNKSINNQKFDFFSHFKK